MGVATFYDILNSSSNKYLKGNFDINSTYNILFYLQTAGRKIYLLWYHMALIKIFNLEFYRIYLTYSFGWITISSLYFQKMSLNSYFRFIPRKRQLAKFVVFWSNNLIFCLAKYSPIKIMVGFKPRQWHHSGKSTPSLSKLSKFSKNQRKFVYRSHTSRALLSQKSEKDIRKCSKAAVNKLGKKGSVTR